MLKQLILVLILLLTSNSALSESISYCGLKLPLDSISAVDPEHVKVVFGGDARIIARSSLEHWLVEKAILEPSHLQNIGTDQLVDFVTQCSRSEAAAVLTAAIREIFLRADNTGFSTIDFLNKSPANIEILKSVLSDSVWEQKIRQLKSPNQIKMISESLAEIALKDPSWIKNSILRLFYLLSESIYSVLVSNFSNQLQSGNIDYLTSASQAISVIGDDSSKGADFIKRAASAATKLYKNSTSIETVQQVISEIEDSESLLDLYYSKISYFIVAKARTLLEADKLQESLDVAALLLPSRTSPDTLDLASEILEGLNSEPEIVVSPKAQQLFIAYSKSDQKVAQRYLDLLETLLVRKIEDGRVQDSEEIFSRIVLVRPDPSKANDIYRIKQALGYKRQNLNSEATAKTSQIQTGISLWSRCQLFFGSGELAPIALVAIVVLLFSFISWKFIKSAAFNALYERARKFGNLVFGIFNLDQSTASSASAGINDDGDNRASAFVKLSATRASSGHFAEYEKKLAQFGLKGNVSLKIIKSAYRSAVKEYHPDLNPNQSEAQTRKFLELNKSYEELLELRQELGLID